MQTTNELTQLKRQNSRLQKELDKVKLSQDETLITIDNFIALFRPEKVTTADSNAIISMLTVVRNRLK